MVELEEVLGKAKRFIYNEMRADYGTARPLEAVLDENAAKWKIICKYAYSPNIFASPETKIVELKIDNTSGKIESFKQVK